MRPKIDEPGHTVGIDLGGTSTRIGVYDEDMRPIMVHRMRTPVEIGPEFAVAEMAEVLLGLMHQSGVSVSGIGIGSPGPINLHTGVLGMLPNLPGWEGFPLRDALEQATGFATILESDSNAAAIGEWKIGAGRETGLDSLAMLTLGTGVGAGLILGGKVWHGMLGMAGEIGHTSIDPNGLLCACGSRGCLEMYTSANGLLRIARDIAAENGGSEALRRLCAQEDHGTPEALGALAREQHDESALRCFAELGGYLGMGVAALLNVLDLPLVIIGGGVANSWSLFAPAMFKAIREYSVVYRLAVPRQLETMEAGCAFVRPALLGADAGLVGAAMLPRLAAGRNSESVQEPVSELAS